MLHYKCVCPLLDSHHPAFSCPLCRTFADLEDTEAKIEQDSDTTSLADIPAAIAVIVMVGNGEQPNMGDTSHSREDYRVAATVSQPLCESFF